MVLYRNLSFFPLSSTVPYRTVRRYRSDVQYGAVPIPYHTVPYRTVQYRMPNGTVPNHNPFKIWIYGTCARNIKYLKSTVHTATLVRYAYQVITVRSTVDSRYHTTLPYGTVPYGTMNSARYGTGMVRYRTVR